MSYQVFARKFRPQRFEHVVGQEHITTTLKNAIKEGRLAQSFLFSGSRGVGKTSTARILAKTLNCEKGVVTEPCNKCDSCEEILSGSSLDVLEIDGASNRGIEEIRNLRENVKFKPARSSFKVYIIDEVHMLTEAAFNALLKTLEEPPEHVKFIFATTELHKVPLTILSRCQKFTFRKVPTETVVTKLKEVAAIEKLKVEEKAYYAIAKAADGSLRDAEGLLDQMASFAKGEVTYLKVIEALGLPEEDLYLSLVDALTEKNAPLVLEIFAPLALEGRDMTQFVLGLAEFFRALLILKVAGDKAVSLDLSPETLKLLAEKKESYTKEDLLRLVHVFQNLLTQLRRSPYPHLHVETTLIKLAIREDLASLSDILEQLDSGAASIVAAPQRPRPAAATAPARPQPPATPASRPAAARPTAPNPATPPQASQPANGAPSANIAQTAPTATVQPPKPQAPTRSTSFGLNEVEACWSDVIESVKDQKMSCGTFLSEAEPVEVAGEQITLGFPSEFKFHKDTLDQLDNRKLIEDAFAQCLGLPVRIALVITVADQAQTTQKPKAEEVPDIVNSAINMFEGKVIRQ